MSAAITASVIYAGASIYSASQAGKGGGGGKRPDMPEYHADYYSTEQEKYMSQGLKGVMQGKGFESKFNKRGLWNRESDELASLDRGYGQAQQSLKTQMNRQVRSDDAVTREALPGMLAHNKKLAEEDIKEGTQLRQGEERSQAISMATTQGAGSIDANASVNSIYNQANQQAYNSEQQMANLLRSGGTYQGNVLGGLAGGIGQPLGTYMYNKNMAT